MTRYNPQKIEESGTAFVYYQDELKEIWRNNVAITNSIVLEDADESHLGSTATSLFQFIITKVPEWTSKKSNVQQQRRQQRQKEIV